MTPRTIRYLTQPLARGTAAGKAALLRMVPKRFHAITDELAKFGTIGLINLVVNFAVFNLLWLTILRSGEVKAKAVATIVATTCAYFLNRYWTYRDRPKSTMRREYTLFFLFNVVGLIIEVTVVGAAKYGFHQTHIVVLNLCTALGIALGTVFRFWAYRTHVFKEASDFTEASTEAVNDVEPRPTEVFTEAEPLSTEVFTEAEPRSTEVFTEAEPLSTEAARVVAVAGADPAAVEADLDQASDDLIDQDTDEDQELQRELVQLELNDIVDQAEQPVRR